MRTKAMKLVAPFTPTTLATIAGLVMLGYGIGLRDPALAWIVDGALVLLIAVPVRSLIR